jgi:acetylglutamate kinase
MRLIVKIGGASLDNPELVKVFATKVSELAQSGHQVAVVHGGGAALTRTMKELGRESTFVDGLRITDRQTRDVALMVLAGQLNKQLVAAVGATGQPAIGLCGGDLHLVRAVKRSDGVDLGFVGDIRSVDPTWVDALWSHGAIPIISSIALGVEGEYYNVNADQMASSFAIACEASALVFLTDVPGVKASDGSIIRWLPVGNIPQLIASATVSGGMLPKLEACTQALKRGVRRVRILPAAQVGVLAGFFTDAIDFGTEVIAA